MTQPTHKELQDILIRWEGAVSMTERDGDDSEEAIKEIKRFKNRAARYFTSGAGRVRMSEPYEPYMKDRVNRWRAGFIVRLSSMWIGIHWSNTNRRLCVNFLPCFTFFVTLANGDLPKLSDYPRRWMIRR